MLGYRGRRPCAEPQRWLSSSEKFFRLACLIRMREYIRPARPVQPTCVNILALHAEKCPNRLFSGVLGEFCTGDAADGGVRGEFCTGCGVGGGVLGEFFAELLRDGPRWASIFVEEPLHALTVNVSMGVRSPCGHRSSAGGPLSHAIPLKVFQVMKPNR